MNHCALMFRVVLALGLVVGAPAAIAALPKHVPGTICVTPLFWCWATYAGRPGTTCSCPLQNGWVQGVLM